MTLISLRIGSQPQPDPANPDRPWPWPVPPVPSTQPSGDDMPTPLPPPTPVWPRRAATGWVVQIPAAYVVLGITGAVITLALTTTTWWARPWSTAPGLPPNSSRLRSPGAGRTLPLRDLVVRATG